MKTLIIILFLFCSLRLFAPGLNIIYLKAPEPITKVYSMTEKLQAIIYCETSGGLSRYNPGETESVGLLQIRPVMVREVNRILGYQKYQLSDRLNDRKAVEMFNIFQQKHNPEMDFEKMCRLWNGGGKGMQKTSTLKYYQTALKYLTT